ncbi:MAG: helix-turn-helix domain-containing protein [Ruminococcus sp.]
MKYSYEKVNYEKNIPAKILMQDKPGWRCRTELHWHKELEMIYMIKGHLDVTVNGKKRSLDDDGLLFCNSEDIHTTNIEDDNKHNRYIVVQLSYEYIREFCDKADGLSFNVDSNPKAVEKIKESLLKLVDYCENSKYQYVDLLKYSEILKIYHILLSECSTSKKNAYISKAPSNFSYAKRVLEYIGKNYKNEISLNDMANLVGLSPAYFSKYFKNITGTSFTHYLNGIRLDYAIKDMLARNSSVTEAALENGFPNVKSFITMCKKVYGSTPAQYKKHYNDN